jgi:hypothetical protein
LVWQTDKVEWTGMTPGGEKGGVEKCEGKRTNEEVNREKE